MDVQSIAMGFMASASSDVESHISIPVGITVGLLASFIQSLGLTIQRKSHVQNQALPEEDRKVEHRRPLWLLGFGIFISSNLFGSIFQIASLPVVILAPLGAVSLLWNAFFARILLGDAFSIWMVLGTLFIAGGAVLIAVFGIVPEPTHSLEDLLVLFSRPAFIAYFSLLGLFTIVCLAATHLVEFSYARRNRIELTASPPMSPLIAPTTAPTILTTAATPSSTFDPTQLTTERTPLLDRKPSRSASPSPSSSITSYTTSAKTPLFLAMSYASFSGIISGMCLLFAKSGVELLVLTIGGKNQFWRWQAWVLVIGLVICALLQLWYMHKSLVLANPTLICPLAFCFYNLSSIVNGLIYFDQFSLLSTTHLLLVTLGITVLLAGVWIVSFPPSGGISIDLASWWEEPEPHVELAEHEEIIDEPYEDEPLPMITQRHSQSSSRQDEILLSSDADVEEGRRIGLGIVSIPEESRGRKPREYASLRINPQAPPKIPSHSHHRGQTDSAVTSFPPVVSPHEAPRSATLASPPITRHARPRATSAMSPSISNTSTQYSLSHSHSHTSPRHSQSLFPYPPGAPSGTVTGFSIGLSPMSPGFALVNRDSRRSNSGRGKRKVSDLSKGKLVAAGMRRVMSDGDVSNIGTPRGDDDGEEEFRSLFGDHVGGVGEEEHGHVHNPGQPSEPAEGRARRVKGRWRWLKGAFGIGR